MNQDIEKKLARSLTAENTELIPYLPYLLQDLWELGTPSKNIIRLIQKHIPNPSVLRVLDLACGKGAVGIPLAKQLGCTVRMVDIIPEFVDFAQKKAYELNVISQCRFAVGDITEVVSRERDWDCVMLLAVGDVLGNPKETVSKLKQTVRPNGYIIIEESYIQEQNKQDIRCEYDYSTHKEWLSAFDSEEISIIEEFEESVDEISDLNDFSNLSIAQRTKELTEKYPQHADLFLQYVKSQLNECYDLENTINAPIWLLQRNN